MLDEIRFRSAVVADLPQLENVYPAAFPDEDLVPVMRALADAGTEVQSTVAVLDDEIIGHVVFSDCGVDGSTAKLTLLGPLLVAPAHQQQGIGTQLVHHAIEEQRRLGVDAALVLGDPNYYGRLGFEAERCIQPPYPLPPEWEGAWQSWNLSRAQLPTGTLSVLDVWDKPELWLP